VSPTRFNVYHYIPSDSIYILPITLAGVRYHELLKKLEEVYQNLLKYKSMNSERKKEKEKKKKTSMTYGNIWKGR
jgi:hypothetical protein